MEKVIYTPGNEPENIRNRIDRLFAKLDEAYPDKVICGLNKDHKKWGETVTQLYRLLGYSSGRAFLEAYGYTVEDQKKGRKSGDYFAIIAELKSRYSKGATCSSMLELSTQNPDLAPKFKSLTNQATSLFGMTLKKYLEQEGILVSKSSQNEGAQKLSTEEKLAQVTEKLKERFSVDNPFPGTVAELIAELDGVTMGALTKWTKKVHNETPKEYFIRIGIMSRPEDVNVPETMKTIPDEQTKSTVEELGETVCIGDVFFVDSGELKTYTGKERVVVIPDCVTRIADDVFRGNVFVRKVFIPDSVSDLGWRLFEGCKNLKEIRLPENMDSLSPDMFKNTGLETITIPKNVKNISRGAFCGCKELEEVVILSSKININPSAFDGMSRVTLYCQNHLVADLQRVTGATCRPLNTAPANENSNEVFYYEDQDLMRNFPDSEPVNQAKNYKITIGSKEFKVRIEAEQCIDEFEKFRSFYTFEETQRNYVTLEEARKEILDADPNMRTDAYLYDARPRIDTENAEKMSRDDFLLRLGFLKKVYRSLNNKETVQRIIEEAPKKKNGSLNLKSYLRIACGGIVDSNCCILEIVAIPKGDTSLKICIKDVFFSSEEIKRLREDYFTCHILKVANNTNESDNSFIQSASKPSQIQIATELPITFENIVIPTTVIKDEDDNSAIQIEPIRSLKSFEFLEGNDTDGYQLQIPDCSTIVVSSGIQVEVLLNQESILDAWKEIGAISSYRQNSDKSADAYQAVMDIVDYRGMDWTQDKLNRIVETNDYISRYVYALLRSVEHIIKHYREYAQESADTARRTKNGDLWPNRPTRFSGFLMEEMELDNFGFSSFASSHTEKNNKIEIVYEGTIEV